MRHMKNFIYDMKTQSCVLGKVALMIGKVLNCPLETVSSEDPHANLFSELKCAGIVDKTCEYAFKMDPGLEKNESDQDSTEDELPN